MLSSGERASAAKPMVLLRAKAERERAVRGSTFQLTLPSAEPVLGLGARELLREFLAFMWQKTAPASPPDRVDMRMTVPDAVLLQLLDENEEADGGAATPSASAVLRKLKEEFARIEGTPQALAVRPTLASTSTAMGLMRRAPCKSPSMTLRSMRAAGPASLH